MGKLRSFLRDVAENEDRSRLRGRIQRLLDKWGPKLGVNIGEWKIRDMKMYWASVNPRDKKITFNLKLVDMTPAFVEATVVHELVHFLTDGHDDKFYELMDRHVPGWRRMQDQFGEKLTRYD